MSLQQRILLTLLPLIVVPMLIVGLVSFGALEETARQLMLKEMNTLLTQVAESSRQQMDNAEANLELLAQDPLLKRYLLAEEGEDRYMLFQGPLLRLFATVQAVHPDYYEIRILTPDGHEDARMAVPGLANQSPDESQSPLYKWLVEQTTTSLALMRDPNTQQHALWVAKPLYLGDLHDTTPRLRGYLVMTVSLDQLRQWVQRTQIGDGGRVAFTNQQGALVFAPDEEWLRQDFNAQLFENHLRRPELQTGMAHSANGNGYLLAWQSVIPGLNAFGILPNRVFKSALGDLATLIGLTTLGTMILVYLLVVAGIHRSLLKPILQLRKLARKLGGDQTEFGSSVDTQDELSELTRTFEQMTSHIHQSNETIRKLAYYDSLTGLPNRTTFRDRLTAAISRARRDQELVGALCIDLDNFKWVNDTLGHAAGDELLVVVSDRLRECLRQEDDLGRLTDEPAEENNPILGRFGGDEFFILLEGLKKPYEATVVARRILQSIACPVHMQEREIFISASIGISVYPHDGEDADTLLRNADVAMYSAKANEKNSYRFYAESMNESAQQKLSLETSLRRAVEREQFELFYQPQIVH